MGIKKIIVCSLGMLFSFSNQACEIAKSQYALLGNKNFTVRFTRHQNDDKTNELLLNLKSKETNQSYWFRLNAGNGYSSLSLTPVSQPLNQGQIIDIEKPQTLNQPIYFIDKNLSFYPSELSSNIKAPQFLLATNLAEALWYSASSLGGGEDIREKMPRGFFKLKRCDK